MEIAGGWNKQKTLAKTEEYKAVIPTDKFISVTPVIKVQMLENTYEMVCEAQIMYGIEVWGLNEAWKDLDKFHSRFFKKLMGLPNCAASGFAETELSRESRRGKYVEQIVKYWYRIMCLDVEFQ